MDGASVSFVLMKGTNYQNATAPAYVACVYACVVCVNQPFMAFRASCDDKHNGFEFSPVWISHYILY